MGKTLHLHLADMLKMSFKMAATIDRRARRKDEVAIHQEENLLCGINPSKISW
jgi:hypothetical protein